MDMLRHGQIFGYIFKEELAGIERKRGDKYDSMFCSRQWEDWSSYFLRWDCCCNRKTWTISGLNRVEVYLLQLIQGPFGSSIIIRDPGSFHLLTLAK